MADNRVAYNSLSREDSVDYDVSSPLARMESLRRDGGAETDTEVTAGSRKRVRVIKYHHRLSIHGVQHKGAHSINGSIRIEQWLFPR